MRDFRVFTAVLLLSTAVMGLVADSADAAKEEVVAYRETFDTADFRNGTRIEVVIGSPATSGGWDSTHAVDTFVSSPDTTTPAGRADTLSYANISSFSLQMQMRNGPLPNSSPQFYETLPAPVTIPTVGDSFIAKLENFSIIGIGSDTGGAVFNWMYWSPGVPRPVTNGNGQDEVFILQTQAVCPTCTGFYQLRYQTTTARQIELYESFRNAGAATTNNQLLLATLPDDTALPRNGMTWRVEAAKSGLHRLTVSDSDGTVVFDSYATVSGSQYMQDSVTLSQSVDSGTKMFGFNAWVNVANVSYDFLIDTMTLSYTRDAAAQALPLSIIPPKKTNATMFGVIGRAAGW